MVAIDRQHFQKKNLSVVIEILQKFVAKGLIDIKSILV